MCFSCEYWQLSETVKKISDTSEKEASRARQTNASTKPELDTTSYAKTSELANLQRCHCID
jgi:hypothetical protein